MIHCYGYGKFPHASNFSFLCKSYEAEYGHTAASQLLFSYVARLFDKEVAESVKVCGLSDASSEVLLPAFCNSSLSKCI